jgi:hypothetical protein
MESIGEVHAFCVPADVSGAISSLTSATGNCIFHLLERFGRAVVWHAPKQVVNGRLRKLSRSAEKNAVLSHPKLDRRSWNPAKAVSNILGYDHLTLG